MGLGGRAPVNMGARSFGGTNLGRGGFNGAGLAGSRNAVGARSFGGTALGRTGLNGGGFAGSRNAFGLGTRAPINGAGNRFGPGLTATSFNRGGFANNSFNRAGLGNSALSVNRATSINNINVNRTGNFANNNFGRFGRGAGWGRFGRGWGGWGFPGGFGWGFPGYGFGWGFPGFGFGGFGLGFGLGSLLGFGLGGWGLGGWGLGYGGWGLGGFGGYGGYGGYGYSPWVYGPSLYDWGYSSYYNPYDYTNGLGGGAVVVDPSLATVYDYSQPLNSQVAPPQPAVADQATTEFDSAREAFKSGDYTKALGLVDQAIKEMPNESALHEFRGVTLFALTRYTEAAAPLYAVLAVGPGWDWDTFISLYPNVSVYTDQLRALEGYCRTNANSAAPRFVLAYLYMTQGSTSAAVESLKRVVALQPKDTISTQLIKRLDPSYSPPSTSAPAPPPAPGVGAAGLKPTSGTVHEGRFEGAWSAKPEEDTAITLTFLDKGRFVWKVDQKGQNRVLQGRVTSGNGLLTLAQDLGPPIVGNVTWTDESHFSFKVPGAGADEPGLSFSKAQP
jgi:tetratricopeptide (TPR) repeat protein